MQQMGFLTIPHKRSFRPQKLAFLECSCQTHFYDIYVIEMGLTFTIFLQRIILAKNGLSLHCVCQIYFRHGAQWGQIFVTQLYSEQI